MNERFETDDTPIKVWQSAEWLWTILRNLDLIKAGVGITVGDWDRWVDKLYKNSLRDTDE